MSNSPEIREGFLCPICLQDFGEVLQLQSHFSEAHRTPEESDLLDTFKGFFDKAKEKLLSIPGESVKDGTNPFEEYSEEEEVPQEIGATTSHTDYFKKERDANASIDETVMKTNRLIIRLDKIINDKPDDVSKRKGNSLAFEKTIALWKPDSEVHNCQFCHSRFSIARRKHHCRLCGDIMCHNCSKFLTFAYARKLINPAVAAGYDLSSVGEAESQSSSKSKPDRLRTAAMATQGKMEKFLTSVAVVTKLKQDGSEVSLGSFFDQDGEEHMRICETCKRLLDQWDSQVESRTSMPIIVQFYERLRELIDDASTMYPTYVKMINSLNDGESFYNLSTAQDLRTKMAKVQEQIDFQSKRIQMLGITDTTEDSPGPSNRQKKLQGNIRQMAVLFLQDVALTMPSVPTQEEYEKIQENRRLETVRRIEEEKQLSAQHHHVSLMAKTSSSGGHNRSAKTKSPARSPAGRPSQLEISGGGWTPEPSKQRQIFDSSDPLQEQIVAIKGYIRQAAESGRLDDVRILELSLKEHQKELARQREELRQTTTTT